MIKTNEQIETDKLLLSCTGLWEEFRINKTKDPINVQEYYNLISNLLDQQLNHSRMWLSSPHAKEYYYAEMQRQKEILQSLDREWDDLLEQTYESVDDLIERVYELGKQKGYNDIKEKLVFTDTDKEALDFVRQYNFHLIKKLSDDLRSSVKNNITQAVATGENPYSLANKIVELGVKPLEGSTLSAKQRAVMIAKTEVSRAQNTGILQSYVNEGYTEVTILTAEDSNVCSLCLDNAYLFNKSEDKVYHPGLKDNVHRISDLDEDSMLPLHPNCRCTYLSVWDSKNDVVEPYIVNLTPFHDLSKLNDIPQVYSPLKEKDIPKFIPSFMHEQMLELDNKLKNTTVEHGYIVNLTSEEIGRIVTNYDDGEVNLNKSMIKVSSEDEIVAAHIHLSSEPFNDADFESFLNPKQNVYSKYMIVHTKEDVFIAEFNKEVINHEKEIIEEVTKEYGAGHFGMGAIHNNIWNNYINNKILNKYITFTRIRK